ncbi:UNVERIFIED_CONTAM: hypothetical protein Slati_4228700 [Sesamum latifolium]|uniref:Uncharacterized protein n=1 Tax=Sesamum latifolium TaxID=2727402 RepID=A0AAW2TCZ1_9LAMI
MVTGSLDHFKSRERGGRSLAAGSRSLTSGSQVASQPGRWLADPRPARAGAADHCFGRKV